MNATAFPSSPGVAAAAPAISRNVVIAGAVVALHVGFIWALQSGLLIRASEIIIPAQILTRFVDPPAPKVEPAKPVPPAPPAPVKKAVTRTTPIQPAPQPIAIADPTPSPTAPTGVIAPQPPAPVAAPVAAAPPAPPAPPAVQLPSSDADYLQNPPPAYPPISRRLGEQGKSIIRVLIGTDGLPQRGEIGKSSGFDRLDQAAMASVMRWRFVPGKRNGVPEAMWFNVPVNWVLE